MRSVHYSMLLLIILNIVPPQGGHRRAKFHPGPKNLYQRQRFLLKTMANAETQQSDCFSFLAKNGRKIVAASTDPLSSCDSCMREQLTTHSGIAFRSRALKNPFCEINLEEIILESHREHKFEFYFSSKRISPIFWGFLSKFLVCV